MVRSAWEESAQGRLGRVCACLCCRDKAAEPCLPHPSNLMLGVLEEYNDADLTVRGMDPGHREIK